MTRNLISASGEHFYVESGVVVVVSGQSVSVSVSGQPVTVSGNIVYVGSGVYLASGIYPISGFGVTTQSGVYLASGIQMDGAVRLVAGETSIEEANLVDLRNLNVEKTLENILKELKKANIQLNLITSNEIKNTDIG